MIEAPLPPPLGAETAAGRAAWLVPAAIAVGVLVLIVGALVAVGVVAARSSAARPGVRYGTVPGADPGTGDTPAGGHGRQVDSVACGPVEQKVSHVHAHLFILNDGVAQPVAAFIGIPGAPARADCYYWLHTHDRSGIIHVEAPDHGVHSLGELFDIWGMPLGPEAVARVPVREHRVAYFVDGVRYTGDPAGITLTRHTQVVIEVGKEVPPPSFNFNGY